MCIVLYNCLCYIMVYINYIIQGKCVSFLRPGTWPPLHNCWTLWLDHGRTEVNKHASVAFQPLQNSQDIGSTWGLKLIENDWTWKMCGWDVPESFSAREFLSSGCVLFLTRTHRFRCNDRIQTHNSSSWWALQLHTWSMLCWAQRTWHITSPI